MTHSHDILLQATLELTEFKAHLREMPRELCPRKRFREHVRDVLGTIDLLDDEVFHRKAFLHPEVLRHDMTILAKTSSLSKTLRRTAADPVAFPIAVAARLKRLL